MSLSFQKGEVVSSEKFVRFHSYFEESTSTARRTFQLIALFFSIKNVKYAEVCFHRPWRFHHFNREIEFIFLVFFWIFETVLTWVLTVAILKSITFWQMLKETKRTHTSNCLHATSANVFFRKFQISLWTFENMKTKYKEQNTKNINGQFKNLAMI